MMSSIIICDKCGLQDKTTENRRFHIDDEECYDGVDAVYTSYDFCDKCYIELFEFFLATYELELDFGTYVKEYIEDRR